MRFKNIIDDDSVPVLAIDVGTGTQDIFLHGFSKDIENSPKFVLPSPTVIVAEKIKRATLDNKSIFLTGSTMGGGPSTMAIKKHLRAGLQVFATPTAAKTVDDDLDEVSSMGIQILPTDPPESSEKINTTDCYVLEIIETLRKFGINIDTLDIAIAVQDHGDAPKGMSDRKFRFEHLQKVLTHGDFLTQAYFENEVPEYFTRMKAAASDLSKMPQINSILVMDTGTAAVLGALEDKKVSQQKSKIIVNVGNGHTLGVSLHDKQVVGVFEHHTGSLDIDKLDGFIRDLAKGKLTNEDVFNDGGHGAFVKQGLSEDYILAVTGPRRNLLSNSSLNPYFAVPNGDMMLSGCFGLVKALKEKQGAA